MADSAMEWAVGRLRNMQYSAEKNAGRLGVKLLKGHGYPDEAMHDAQDALALSTVLAAVSAPEPSPVREQDPQWVIRQCLVLARRILTRANRLDDSKGGELAGHIIRLCEGAGATTGGVLRELAPEPSGDERTTPSAQLVSAVQYAIAVLAGQRDVAAPAHVPIIQRHIDTLAVLLSTIDALRQEQGRLTEALQVAREGRQLSADGCDGSETCACEACSVQRTIDRMGKSISSAPAGESKGTP